MCILTIQDLSVSFPYGTNKKNKQKITVLNGLYLSLQKGKITGLVGESGSGKTVTSLSIMNLIADYGAVIESGNILFEGRNLLTLPPKEIQALRGSKIALIPQNPMASFNPVKKIGKQLIEIQNLHESKQTKTTQKDKKNKIHALLTSMQFTDIEGLLKKYPFELSGGMCQRLAIAQALLCNPSIIIADEPTTALDVVTQKSILSLFQSLAKEQKVAILLITHNMGVISEICDFVYMLYCGELVEYGETKAFIQHALHPYAKALIASIPENFNKKTQRFYAMPQEINEPSKAQGCVFFNRCSIKQAVCATQKPNMIEIEKNHFVACYHYAPNKE